MADTPFPLPREIRQTDVMSGDGGSTYGPFEFKIFDAADAKVFVRLAGQADFNEAVVTVSKVSDLPQDFFTVSFSPNLPADAHFVVAGMRLGERTAGVRKGSQIDPTALEKEFSKLVATGQELRRDVGRAVAADYGEEVQKLPAPDEGRVLGWAGGKLANLQALPQGSLLSGAIGLLLLAAGAVDVVRDLLDTPSYVATRNQLRALDPARDKAAILMEGVPARFGRFGTFVWASGDFSAQVAADTQEGVFIKAGSVAASVGAWIRVLDGPVTPFHFGAKGDIATDDTTAWAAALKFAANGKIHVPAGTHKITSLTRWYGHTEIEFAKGAGIYSSTPQGGTFVNGVAGTDYATLYGGDGDLKVVGGEFSMNLARSVGSAQGAYFQVGHATNVVFDGCQFLNCYRGHAVEVNACKMARFSNCRFLGQVVEPGDSGRDAINVDFAYAVGFPVMGAYDNAECQDIIVEGCYFNGWQAGAASHGATAPPIYPIGIRILNCTFEAMTEYAIRGRYWRNAVIEGNTIITCPDKGIYLDACVDCVVKNNTVKGAAQTVSTHAIQFTDCTRCLLIDNSVSNAGYAINYVYALRLLPGCVDCVVVTNGLAIKGSSGVVSNTGQMNKVDGAIYFTVADDAARAVPVPRDSRQGLVVIATESDQSYSQRGVYWYRSTATAAFTAAAKVAAANTAETTGILTGGTGVDGRITLSAHTDGNLYVENRSGNASVAFNVTFL